MKNKTATSSDNKAQDNIGYENTKTRNNNDNHENKQMQPAKTGDDEGPKENESDTEGLRSESGSKSLGKKKGNGERG